MIQHRRLKNVGKSPNRARPMIIGSKAHSLYPRMNDGTGTHETRLKRDK